MDFLTIYFLVGILIFFGFFPKKTLSAWKNLSPLQITAAVLIILVSYGPLMIYYIVKKILTRQ